VLVLYDDRGSWGWLGELYATLAGNLASHFGEWRALPVRRYRAGDLSRAAAGVYVGSTYDEELPASLLDDVLSSKVPVLWAGDNIWQLAKRAGRFGERFGFVPGTYDQRQFNAVHYKGETLSREPGNPAHPLSLRMVNGGPAKVLATATGMDGEHIPWAVRAQHLTFLVENPFAYVSETDRYLVFCDLLFDLLKPDTPERHRALVRIEDVMPIDDPGRLRAIADTLAAEGVPFAIAVIPLYVDPWGTGPGARGEARTVRWTDVPDTLAALKYMIAKGGVPVMHGYTHQAANRKNPSNGVSGQDFEFWTAHLDDSHDVVLDGPIAEDSAEFVASRARRGLEELDAAGLGRPDIFEFPHYTGSATDSRTLTQFFGAAYHRGFYFGGLLTERPPDARHFVGQFFPYEVTDVYGWHVLPENLGYFTPGGHHREPARLAADLIHNAKVNRIVRDGFASFYFHTYYDAQILNGIVKGIKQAGYVFVSAQELVRVERAKRTTAGIERR
jgi:uncharacterized protein YdaL